VINLLQNQSIILYILLFFIVTIYIVYRIVLNKHKRILATKELFNKINFIDLEIGLLEGENMLDDEELK